jgi:hypothetical protein
MSDLPAATGSNRLPVLAASINDHLAAAEAATRRGLEHAIAAGALLLEAKALVPHGEWLAWLEVNCHVGMRQAQTFMRLARHRDRLDAVKCESAAHLTIAAAEALVGRPKPERAHGLPGQMDMLGAPEVTAPAKPSISDHERLLWLIADLELALAITLDEQGRVPRDHKRTAERDARQRTSFRRVAITLAAAIAFLKS